MIDAVGRAVLRSTSGTKQLESCPFVGGTVPHQSSIKHDAQGHPSTMERLRREPSKLLYTILEILDLAFHDCGKTGKAVKSRAIGLRLE